MKAIIVAGGLTEALGGLSAGKPCCMVEVGGTSILQHQVAALKANGIEDIVVVAAERPNAISVPGAKVVTITQNKARSTLHGLFSAREDLVGDTLISEGNVLFGAAIVERLLNGPGSASLVVDVDWLATSQARQIDEVGGFIEATAGGSIIQLGAAVPRDRVYGVYVGLARFRSSMVAKMWAMFERAAAAGSNVPYGHSSTFGEAHLTDLVNDAINQGEHFAAIPIAGGCREIRTIRDLELAEADGPWS